MLIVSDDQRLRAGIGSLSKRCSYCSKAEASYPLILSDEAKLAVYHAACAAALATEILVDLYTFLSSPAPYPTNCATRSTLIKHSTSGTKTVGKRVYFCVGMLA